MTNENLNKLKILEKTILSIEQEITTLHNMEGQLQKNPVPRVQLTLSVPNTSTSWALFDVEHVETLLMLAVAKKEKELQVLRREFDEA